MVIPETQLNGPRVGRMARLLLTSQKSDGRRRKDPRRSVEMFWRRDQLAKYLEPVWSNALEQD
jgi:hypothetical protein